MHVRDWVCFILFWGIAILLVNPLGEFPLNDDWGYARVVQQLVETGEYDPGTWPVMNKSESEMEVEGVQGQAQQSHPGPEAVTTQLQTFPKQPVTAQDGQHQGGNA